MLVLLSPSKAMHVPALPGNCSADEPAKLSQPVFLPYAQSLWQILHTLNPQQLGELLAISPKLAQLNWQRYQSWGEGEPQAAIYTFAGDVYKGLDAASLSADSIAFAQKHLRILSGLYGLLAPMDAIWPYRLDMGTRLHQASKAFNSPDLYSIWRDGLPGHLDAYAQQQGFAFILSLASQEYHAALINPGYAYKTPIIQARFEQQKANGSYASIGLKSKYARGLMTRFIVQYGITQAQEIKNFQADGYRFMNDLSTQEVYVFRMKSP